MIKCC